MRGTRGLALASVLALATALAVAPAAHGAKAKKKAPSVFAGSVQPALAVPNGAAGLTSVPVTSTITVPKKFKGKSVGDVNVTGIRTTGSTNGAASGLFASLRAPNGRTIELFFTLPVTPPSLGPWTLDDDSPVSICTATPPVACPNPAQALSPPFAGTSNLNYNWAGAFPTNTPLQTFDGVPMRGTWTLRVADLNAGGTNTLDAWGLRIAAAKPVKG